MPGERALAGRVGRSVSVLLLAAMALQGPPAPLPSHDLAFVNQCRFANGPRVILAHRFNTANYRLVIVRGPNDNLLVTVTPRAGREPSYDSEGTVRDTAAVGALLDWLLRQPMRALTRDDFMDEFTRTDSPPCPAGLRVPR
jgi:hypothetical protein